MKNWRNIRSMYAAFGVIILAQVALFCSQSFSQESLSSVLIGDESVDPAALAASSAIANQISSAEWLGPLSAVALSPFFGLACLSGLATYGPEWIQQRSSLLHASSPMNSPWLFWTLTLLAVLTSLPRFFKVSKPIALSAEKMEAYSAIIILIAVRFLGGSSPTSEGTDSLALAGFGSMDFLMALAAGLNVVVVNGVKLCIELLVWLIPIPLIDAALEVANKSMCGMLLGLYCYSPWLASIVNLMIFAAAAVTFQWTARRVAYYHDVIVGPMLAWLLPAYFGRQPDHFYGFLLEPWEGLPTLTKIEISQQGSQGYRVQGRSWLKRIDRICKPDSVSTESGLVIQQWTMHTTAQPLRIGHRRWLGQEKTSDLKPFGFVQ